MSISFDWHDIEAAIKHLGIEIGIEKDGGFWLEASCNVVYLHFALSKEELIGLINDGKTQCLDWQDDEDSWHELEDYPHEELADGTLNCRYILATS